MDLPEMRRQIWQNIDSSAIFNPILLFSLFFFITVFLKITRGDGKISPPSPPRLPIIGNLHQMGKNPHRSMRELSYRYGPLMLLYFGSLPTLVVSSSELAREILRTHETIFTHRPKNKAADILFLGCRDILLAKYDDHWRQMRKVAVLELLSLRRVQSFQFVREEEVTDILETISRSCQNGSSVNICKMMVSISNNIVSRSVLGKTYERIDDNENSFGETLLKAIDGVGSFWFGDFIPYLGWIDTLTGSKANFKKASAIIHSFLDQIIDEHQIPKSDNHQTDKKDFVDIMLDLQNNGQLDIELSRDSLKSILLDMLIAGTDTSASMMEWIMAELVKNPTLMKKTQEEVRKVVGRKSKVEEVDVNQMIYLKCVIKESLRLHSNFFLFRESNKNVKLAGYEIPAKSRFFINLWAIQRDPSLWDRPEEFIPERFVDDPMDFKGQDPRYSPFGTGRRGCPGITYAIFEMEYVIANLLYWFDWKFPDGTCAETLDMEEAFEQSNRKKIPLRLVPELHTN